MSLLLMLLGIAFTSALVKYSKYIAWIGEQTKQNSRYYVVVKREVSPKKKNICFSLRHCGQFQNQATENRF